MLIIPFSTAHRILRSVILTSLLAAAGGTAFAQTPVRVTFDGAAICSAPSTSSVVLTTVQVGTTLQVVAQVGDWLEVRLPSDATRAGYILVQQVDDDRSGPSTVPGTSEASHTGHASESPSVDREALEPGLPAAQGTAPTAMPMDMAMGSSRWQFMQDAVLFGMYNNQGGARGGAEFKAPNWWMGMANRKVGATQLTLNTMFSFDPVSTQKDGYQEIFQVGEALHGRPLIDRQHPHDFFMQLAAVWRIPVGAASGVTVAGGPAGEPALGPIAFMHRASAAENPMAPLSHHTFDSTHIAFGVVTAAVDHGPVVVEASLFNGREPDENRWNVDVGRLDSAAARVWFRPTPGWEFQVSSGRLKHPEELEEGNITRTTASGSWLKLTGADFTAVTAAYGINITDEVNRHAVLVEGTVHRGLNSVYARGERVDVETSLLLTDRGPARLSRASTDSVGALTVGGIRDILRWAGIEGGIGAGVTVYAVPPALRPSHGARPVSFQIYFRLRPPAGAMGRMWNMRMSQPMQAMPPPAMDHQHAGH